MRFIVFMVVALGFMSGCTSFNGNAGIDVPVPASRSVASDEKYLNLAFDRYFANQNFYIRLVRMELLAKQLEGVMPEKGHAKKALVAQFIADLHRAVALLAADNVAVTSKYSSWIPSAQENGFNEKIRVLGKVLQSSKVMDRLGIYLTASGVFDEDNYGQTFYFNLIDRALYEIDGQLRNLVMVYPPEAKDADENEAKLQYTKSLAGEVRLNLRKVIPSVNSVEYKKLDALLQRISKMSNISQSQAQKLMNSPDFKYTKQVLSQVQLISSGDILGFEDQQDATIATKFNFEMINELISSVR